MRCLFNMKGQIGRLGNTVIYNGTYRTGEGPPMDTPITDTLRYAEANRQFQNQAVAYRIPLQPEATTEDVLRLQSERAKEEHEALRQQTALAVIATAEWIFRTHGAQPESAFEAAEEFWAAAREKLVSFKLVE